MNIFIVHRHGADSQNADAPVTFEDGTAILELPDGSQVRFLTSDMQAVLGGQTLERQVEVAREALDEIADVMRHSWGRSHDAPALRAIASKALAQMDVLGGEKAAVVSLVAQPPSDLLDFARLKRIKRRGRR